MAYGGTRYSSSYDNYHNPYGDDNEHLINKKDIDHINETISKKVDDYINEHLEQIIESSIKFYNKTQEKSQGTTGVTTPSNFRDALSDIASDAYRDALSDVTRSRDRFVRNPRDTY